jgi:hypothetical protein
MGGSIIDLVNDAYRTNDNSAENPPPIISELQTKPP